MSDSEGQANFVKPIVVEGSGDVTELSCRIRKSLNVNHAHCPEADRVGLTANLLTANSASAAILGEGFRSLVIFDARRGLTPLGHFDLGRFLQYLAQQMASAFDLELSAAEFHPEEISQILKDETEMSLFCFLNIQHMPYVALERLRGFTQEGHRCLFCGAHEFGHATELDEFEPFDLDLGDETRDLEIGNVPIEDEIDVSDDSLGDVDLNLGFDDSDDCLDSRVDLVFEPVKALLEPLPDNEFLN